MVNSIERDFLDKEINYWTELYGKYERIFRNAEHRLRMLKTIALLIIARNGLFEKGEE